MLAGVRFVSQAELKELERKKAAEEAERDKARAELEEEKQWKRQERKAERWALIAGNLAVLCFSVGYIKQLL